MGAYGIMGGTFDPIHYGHLLIAERAREDLGLSRVIFVPAGRPAHKWDWAVTDGELRWRMVGEAVRDNPAFEVSRVEIDRPGPSYAYDTVLAFREMYGDDTPYFIVGMDTLAEVPTWHRSAEVTKMVRFVAASRPGADFESFKRDLPDSLVSRVCLLATPMVDISSTEIRARVSRAKSVRYMLPPEVRTFIRDHCLYQECDES